MTHSQLHDRAALLARSRGISHSAALSLMGQAAAAKRKHRRLCAVELTHPADTAATRQSFNITQPEPRYWWLKDN